VPGNIFGAVPARDEGGRADGRPPRRYPRYDVIPAGVTRHG